MSQTNLVWTLIALLLMGCWWFWRPAVDDVPPPAATEEVTGPCLLYTDYEDAYVRIEPSRITAALGRLQPGTAYPVLRRNQDGAWFMVDFDGITAWAGVQSTRLEGDCSGLPVYEAGEEIPSATEEPRG